MTTWVLLRGLTREARHWGDFAGRLASRLPPGDRVLAIDLPGNGRLHAQRSPSSAAGLAAACRAELDRLGHPGPYVVVALSLGAMVALEWAALPGSGVRGCVLLNTSLGGLSPFWQRLRPGAWPAVARIALAGSARREALVLALTCNHAVTPSMAADWAAWAAQCPVSRLNAARQLVAAATCRAPAKPPVPVLLLASERDRLVSPGCTLAIARAWRASAACHPSAGHDLPLDDPEWVISHILDWLACGVIEQPSNCHPGVTAPVDTGGQFRGACHE
jgi:pimeloyl-ACP methyl ester carboxylesterase